MLPVPEFGLPPLDHDIKANLSMDKKRFQVKPLCYFALALSLAAPTAQAADTDVYLNQSSTVFPNVMFSLDTSGSMQYWYAAKYFAVVHMPPDFSRWNNYSGPFDTSKFYLVNNGRIPNTASGLATAPLASLGDCNFATSPLRDDGFTSIRAAAAFSSSADVGYPKNRWVPASKTYFDFSNSNHLKIECEDDSGNHGSASGGGGAYTNSSSGSLYANNNSNEIDWDKYPYVTVYSGKYLNYKKNPPTKYYYAREELQNRVVRDAIKRTPDIMAGLARMYGSTGGGIIRAAKNNSIRANQLELISALENTQYGGATPLATTLLEVMHYYHGLDLNRTSNYTHGNPTSPEPDYPALPSDPVAATNGTYNSPIAFECQKNYVILVTDGEPSEDSWANGDFTAANTNYPNYSAHTGVSACAGNCLEEIAGYMSKQDASPLANNYDLDGDGTADPQTIQVYPIGMENTQTLLDDAATAAGTQSYYSSGAEEFENAFVEIIATIKAAGGVSMITASSSNDRFSKTSNREFLYYGQFVPSSRFQWKGNLKKYRYAYDENGVAYVTDSDTVNNPDITTDDGGSVSSAKSYWSTTADGNDALTGGVVDRLKARTAARLIRGITDAGDIDVSIMTSSNVLSVGNSDLIAAMNVSDRSYSEKVNILNYVQGKDVHDEDEDGNTTEQRASIGGIVRSSPVAVQYGGTRAEPKVVIFTTTTDGVLHAFDDATGDELWAVVMPEAYSHFSEQHDNYFSPNPWWGIDGALASRVVDVDEDGVIEEGDNDKVYLYVSAGIESRRWMMLDVTRAMKGSDQVTLVRRAKYDTSNNAWDELGMAITEMVPLTYRLADDAVGVKNRAMVYANGWDPEAEYSYEPSSMGRGISLYDASTGAPLWQMSKTHGNSGMDYAFATQPTTVDLNGDGYTDLIYAIDVNAQIWRFNVKNGASNTASLISGGKLATLGSNSNGERRRAYKRIDAYAAGEGLVMLAVGTGDRMNPLSETDKDRLYVIHDRSASTGSNPSSVINNNDLYDATENHIGQGSEAQSEVATTALGSKSGWYIKLPSGQKAISAPLISSGIVNFPVYQIGGTAANACEDNSTGSGLLYRMNILDATPVSNYDGEGGEDLTKNDRAVQIRGKGIPGDVGFHTSDKGVKTIIVNRDTFVNFPDKGDPNLNSTPEYPFHGDAAGYWFE